MDQIIGFSVGTSVGTCVGGIVHSTLRSIIKKNDRPVFILPGFGLGFLTGGISGIISSTIIHDFGIFGGAVAGALSGVVVTFIE
jgi:hypothetical protein